SPRSPQAARTVTRAKTAARRLVGNNPPRPSSRAAGGARAPARGAAASAARGGACAGAAARVVVRSPCAACIMRRPARQGVASPMEAPLEQAGAPAADARLLTPRFVRVTAANFFSFPTFASFFLLPLHARALGGSARTIGL